MLELIQKFFSWLSSLWGKVPESLKEKIITIIIDSFEEILRAYFRDNKKENK
jgi:hypothetical protein